MYIYIYVCVCVCVCVRACVNYVMKDDKICGGAPTKHVGDGKCIQDFSCAA